MLYWADFEKRMRKTSLCYVRALEKETTFVDCVQFS